MPRRGISVGLIIAVCLIGAAGMQLSGAFGSDTDRSGFARSSAQQLDVRQAFPILQSADERAQATLPTIADEPTLTAKASLAAGGSLELTVDGELCMEIEDTATCQPGVQAVRSGVSVAELNCSATDPSVTIQGVAPIGATHIELVRNGEVVGQATAESDGTYHAHVPGTGADELHVGSATVPFAVACTPEKVIVASPPQG